jgi:hypothetical protein
MVDPTRPGTGIGATSAAYEAADAERIAEDALARKKKGYPCGTHTLARRRPQDVTPGWTSGKVGGVLNG